MLRILDANFFASFVRSCCCLSCRKLKFPLIKDLFPRMMFYQKRQSFIVKPARIKNKVGHAQLFFFAFDVSKN